MTYGEIERDGALIRTGWTLMPLVSCVAPSFKGSVWQSRLSEEETVRRYWIYGGKAEVYLEERDLNLNMLKFNIGRDCFLCPLLITKSRDSVDHW